MCGGRSAPPSHHLEEADGGGRKGAQSVDSVSCHVFFFATLHVTDVTAGCVSLPDGLRGVPPGLLCKQSRNAKGAESGALFTRGLDVWVSVQMEIQEMICTSVSEDSKHTG